jgi:hypothetical protein
MRSRKGAPALEAQLSGEATLYEKIVGRFKKPRLSRDHALEARPVRNPALVWEELDSGEVKITLPRRADVVGKLLSAVFYIPKSRPISLDVVGARVWKLADGEHTVRDMVDALMDEHKLHRREAEVSLTEFLRMLGKRNMVAFVVPTEFLDAVEEEAAPGEQPAARPARPATPRKTSSKKGRKRKR